MHTKLTGTILTQGMCKFNILYACRPLTKANVPTDKIRFSDWTAVIRTAKVQHNHLAPNNVFHSSQSRMAKFHSMKVGDANVFRLSDYDCIGFDLDNTICRYKLTNMVKLEYEIVANYLIKEKGYDSNYLLKPFEADIDFVKKGLLLDFMRGNVMQIRCDGYIEKASHGTRFLSGNEIEEIYGRDRKWGVAEEFTQNMLEAWNGPLSEKVRTLLDYFDMPASLVFARIVDSLDAKEGRNLGTYMVWPDVLDALIYMYQRENFTSDGGDYFPALKRNPDLYINKCSVNVLEWLKSMRNKKIVFLITGSHIDFASFTANHSMGADWRSLFHVVVSYARKPGFFTGMRPFIKLDGFNETDPISGGDMKVGSVYSQGNWQDLYRLLGKASGKKTPKCVYIGDNLIQDVYTPSEYTKCDTVSVVEELSAEGMIGTNDLHTDAPVLVSKGWGSYFCCNLPKDDLDSSSTLWGKIIRTHSRICVPDLEYLANHPLDHKFPPFVIDNENKCKQMGYYPSCPLPIVPTIKTQLQKMRRPMNKKPPQQTFRMKRLMQQQSDTMKLVQAIQEERSKGKET